MYYLTRIEFNLVKGQTKIYGIEEESKKEVELLPTLSQVYPDPAVIGLTPVKVEISKSQEKMLNKLLIVYAQDMPWYQIVKKSN